MAPGAIPSGHVTRFPLKVLEEWASSDFLGKDQDYDYYSTSIFLSCQLSVVLGPEKGSEKHSPCHVETVYVGANLPFMDRRIHKGSVTQLRLSLVCTLND